jgi:hypothetical protein
VAIGAVSSTGPLVLAPFASSSGSLKSEPDYPIKVDATFVHGSDYIRHDPSGEHVRLDVNSVLKNNIGPPTLIKFSYTGIIKLTEGSAAVLQGKGEPKTTDFGDACKFVSLVTLALKRATAPARGTM